MRVLNSDMILTVSDDGGRGGYRPIVERYCKNNGGCDPCRHNLFAKQSSIPLENKTRLNPKKKEAGHVKLATRRGEVGAYICGHTECLQQ